ncbi:MAG: M28 family peptidase [bacterium]
MPAEKIRACINYDMISRNSPNDSLGRECSVVYTEGRDTLKQIYEANLENYKVDLKVKFRPSSGKWGGSDYVPFAHHGVPFLATFGGSHTEYHKPFDESWKCDISKMVRILQLNFAGLWELAKWLK